MSALAGRYRNVANRMVPEQLRRAIMSVTLTIDIAQVSDHIRIFPGTGPGPIFQPVFLEHDIREWGQPQIDICREEIEKWQRDGI